MQFSARGRIAGTPARVVSRAERGLPQPRAAAAAARVGRLDHRSWAYTVALVVYAYAHGGAAAVGLVGVIRWVPAAISSPFAAMLGDRYPRVAVMLAADLLRALGLAAMAVCVLTEGPVAAGFGLASVGAGGTTAVPPEGGGGPSTH